MANANNSQPSFIPKKPTSAKRQIKINAFSLTGYIILLLTIVAIGAVYGFNYWLTQNITERVTQLGTAKEVFPDEEFERYKQISARADESGGLELIKKNLSSVQIFSIVRDLTPVNVRYSDFSYSGAPGADGELSMRVETDSFGAAAFQLLQYQESEIVNSVELSDLGLIDDGVRFDLQARIASGELTFFEFE